MSSINSVSSSGNAFPTAPTKPNQQTKADFKALSDALKANDLAAAQAAFAALKKDNPTLAKKLSDQANDSTQKNPLTDLATALDKGDLGAAQTAMAAMKKGHHGHHRPAASKDDSSNASTAIATDTTGTSTTGTVIDVKV